MTETRDLEIVGSRVSWVDERAACLLMVCRYGRDEV